MFESLGTRQVLAFTLNAADPWTQLCCTAISNLPLSAVETIDLDAALMENNIDHEHFLGTWERSFLISSILSCFTSSNGAGAWLLLSHLRLGVRPWSDVLGGVGRVLWQLCRCSQCCGDGSPLAGLNKVALRKTQMMYLMQGAVFTCSFAVRPESDKQLG